MKISWNKAKNAPPQGYEIVIKTMEGDADDYHTTRFHCGMDEAELRRYVIAAEVMGKTYPHGRGGDCEYEGEYWDLLSEDWPRESNSGIADSIDGWEVIYHDGNGIEYPCTITLEKEDKDEIDSAYPQDGGRPLLDARRMAISMLEGYECFMKTLKNDKSLDEAVRLDRIKGWEEAKPRYEKELKDAEEELKLRGIKIE